MLDAKLAIFGAGVPCETSGIVWVGVDMLTDGVDVLTDGVDVLTWLGLGDKLGDEFRLEVELLINLLFIGLLLDPLEADGAATLSEPGALPVFTPPLVFLRVGIPPANRPPMPGKGPVN